jgi:hypothetical protein
MFYKPETLQNTVERMRKLGDQLVPYNLPQNEEDINILKSTETVVDGYEVCIYFTKSKFEDHCTEICQVWGKYAPFLPFVVVCKIAKSFLGNSHLSLVELFKGNRKVYCWAVNTNHDGKPIRSPYSSKTEECSYEGFNYSYMQPSQVNFY